MKDLYAPWRQSYSCSDDSTKDEDATGAQCVFCKQLQDNDDAKNFILKRYSHCFVVLNKYPYNAGHLMVLPLEHQKNLAAISSQARNEIMETINVCCTVLEKELKAQGVNIGLNLGKASGAGIPSHFHWHVLPRWHGDTNFLPALADIKVISFDLQETFTLLKQHFKD